MTEILNGNCLVAQSGGPTSVINSSLAGVITEALNHECIKEIYGGLNGVQGILQEQLVDLASETQQNIRGLRYTPGAALGLAAISLKVTQTLIVYCRYLKHTIFAISSMQAGNDSQDTAR